MRLLIDGKSQAVLEADREEVHRTVASVSGGYFLPVFTLLTFLNGYLGKH